MWGFQFDVQDAGSSVWVGGTEHMITRYEKSSMRRTDSAITREGGDFQDLHLSGNTIYGACHCGDFLFQGRRHCLFGVGRTRLMLRPFAW